MELIFNNAPKTASATDFAYHELKTQILNLTLEPGKSIVEEELTKELGVSRTPLREALSRLQIEHLIIKQPNKRLKVSPISVKEAKEIFQVRAHLEGIAVREATENATKEDIENLHFIVNVIQQMSEVHNIEKILAYGEQFHFYIYKMSDNETIKNILLQLNNRIKRYRNLVPANKNRLRQNEKDDHSLIFECIKNGDKEKAEQLMKSHLEASLHIATKAIHTYNNLEKSES